MSNKLLSRFTLHVMFLGLCKAAIGFIEAEKYPESTGPPTSIDQARASLSRIIRK